MMQVRNNDIESAIGNFDLCRRSDEWLERIRDHFKRVAHLASVPENRRDSEALVAACEYEIARRAGTLKVKFSYD